MPRIAVLLIALVALLRPARAADEAVPGAGGSAAQEAWLQSEAGRSFRAQHAAFLKKSDADSRMDFKVSWLDIHLVFVAPGRFTMGDDGGDDDELPATPVTISRGFWIGKYEITQEEWQSLMSSNMSRHKGAQRPVEFISWKLATDFCKRLTDRERLAGRLPPGYVYRLPTEAEWEYVCRRGLEGGVAGVTPNTGWYAVNSKLVTHPVGQKDANALGIHDMFGNVSEWCYDWFGRYPGKPVTDYSGPSEGDFRVTRGGCSFDIAYGCRPSYRTGAEPNCISEAIGMRVALAPDLDR